MVKAQCRHVRILGTSSKCSAATSDVSSCGAAAPVVDVLCTLDSAGGLDARVFGVD